MLQSAGKKVLSPTVSLMLYTWSSRSVVFHIHKGIKVCMAPVHLFTVLLCVVNGYTHKNTIHSGQSCMSEQLAIIQRQSCFLLLSKASDISLIHFSVLSLV